MSNAKPTRLNKVARELNVGISTIVEFLSGKGHEIESNPNTKIGPEIYAILLEEYQDDQAKKEEALNAISTEVKETISIDDTASKKPSRKQEGDELMIKNIENISDTEIIKPKVEDQDVKVVGKIDLDSMNTKTRPDKKKDTEKAEAKEKEEEKKKKEEEDKKAGEEAEAKKKEENKKPEVETLETKVDKLDGPNIVGKIELPAKKEKKKKPVASSSEDANTGKRKRKRISNNKVDKSSGGGNDRRRSGKGRGRGKKEEKPELTEEQIQAQIKETLARLSGGGKSKGAKHRRAKRDAQSEIREEELKQQAEQDKTLEVTEFVTANELASMMDVTVTEVISACMELGMFVSINQRLDAETLTIVAEEFGYEIDFISAKETEGVITEIEDSEEDLVTRPPIVTVMGHVDHGKTSLLDHIRSANVIAGEAGGITQHIGAYSVTLEDDRKITFLDTPGHEAFTAMRARGAQVTDIAIIVVAADDSIMPQTKEAINHAQAAGVPMVFAINKIDKPGANPDKIKEALSGMNILVEDWGGKFQSQDVSAKQGTNMQELLEKVLLESELLELKANPNRSAVGVVIESELDKGRGYVSTILVQKGTLRKGDVVVAGSYSGRVKAMHNERGQEIEIAGPATPVELLGLNGAPSAGDTFNVMADEKEAKNIANKRMQLQREQGMRTKKHITLDEIGRRIAIGDFQELNVIVKGDVDGSIEALADSMLKLSTEKIQVNVIHKSVGQISESDVLLASASDAIIIGFQVRPSVSARKLAEKEEIDIRLYSIIYDAIEELKSAMEGMLKPTIEEKIVGNIEVREVFKISKVGTVAGCYVLDGKVGRNNKVRIIRDGIVIYEGNLGSLKRFKDDVKEVSTGYECGLNVENFNDIKVGDIIEGYEMVEVEQKL